MSYSSIALLDDLTVFIPFALHYRIGISSLLLAIEGTEILGIESLDHFNGFTHKKRETNKLSSASLRISEGLAAQSASF